MDENRSHMVEIYRRSMQERWQKGRLSLEDVRALKVLCETLAITLAEHEETARLLGIRSQALVDANNQQFSDWLKERRQRPVVPAGAQGRPPGGLRFAIPHSGAFSAGHRDSMRTNLPSPPRPWHNTLAIVAAVAAVLSILAIIFIY